MGVLVSRPSVARMESEAMDGEAGVSATDEHGYHVERVRPRPRSALVLVAVNWIAVGMAVPLLVYFSFWAAAYFMGRAGQIRYYMSNALTIRTNAWSADVANRLARQMPADFVGPGGRMSCEQGNVQACEALPVPRLVS